MEIASASGFRPRRLTRHSFHAKPASRSLSTYSPCGQIIVTSQPCSHSSVAIGSRKLYSTQSQCATSPSRGDRYPFMSSSPSEYDQSHNRSAGIPHRPLSNTNRQQPIRECGERINEVDRAARKQPHRTHPGAEPGGKIPNPVPLREILSLVQPMVDEWRRDCGEDFAAGGQP